MKVSTCNYGKGYCEELICIEECRTGKIPALNRTKRLPCLDCDNDGRVCPCLSYERYKKDSPVSH